MVYEQLKLENQLCFPFYAVSRLIMRVYQEDLDKLELTYTQYLVLLVLWENDNMSVNQIAEKLILNTNTITPLLKRMETSGIIKRTQSSNDQRKVIVSLTEKGNNLKTPASEIPYRLMSKLNIEPTDNQIQDTLILKKKLNELIDILTTYENK